MKKITFKVIATLMALSLIMVSCREEPFDINNPDRPWVPLQAQIDGPTGPIIGTQEVLFTASSQYAETYVWHRNGVVLTDETSNTLRVTATGFFPDVVGISVSGENPSGIGEVSDTNTIMFTPWEAPQGPNAPHAPFIQGESNVCPDPYALLTAHIWQATDFFWYLDGVLIEGENARTLRVELVFCEDADTLMGGTGTGIYTVRGSNDFDGNTHHSEMSPPVFIQWTRCDLTDFSGIWTGIGSAFFDAVTMPPSFRQEISRIGPATFAFENFGGFLGSETGAFHFSIDMDGDPYVTSGRNVIGNVYQWLVAVEVGGPGAWVFNPGVAFNLDILDDGNTIRTPIVTVNTADGPALAYLTLGFRIGTTGGTFWNPGSGGILFYNLTFTRDGGTAATTAVSNEQRRTIQEIHYSDVQRIDGSQFQRINMGR